MKLSDVSIKRPVFTTMIMMALIVFGLICYKNIGVDLYPKVDFPVLTVVSVLPGADAETIENMVTEPIEDAISSLSSIKHLNSVSAEGVSHVFVQFDLEKNVDVAYQELQEKLASVRRQLPDDVKDVIINKFDVDSMPIMGVMIAGNLPIERLSYISDKLIKDRLQQVSGVGQIKILGKQSRNIWIDVDPFKLQGNNLTIQDITQSLRSQHIEMPGGTIETGSKDISLKIKAEFQNVDDLSSVVIAYRNGHPLTIKDVATVIDGVEEKDSVSRLNDQEAISISIQRQSGANTVSVAKGLRTEIKKLQTELAPQGITIEIANDSAVFIEHSLHEIQFHLIFGGILAVIIVFLFLRNFRVTMISALAIPISVISTFIFLKMLNFTLNMMTMLALSLSIGVLIDDAIVVIENIYRHFKGGKSAHEAAKFGTAEIGLAAFAITMSIVAVFLPVAFMKGIIGRFFYQFGMTVVIAVLISLFVAFTLIPMLSAKWLKFSDKKLKIIDMGLKKLDVGYGFLLRKALTFKKTSLAIAASLLIVTVVMSQFIPMEFAPSGDRSEFTINIKTELGLSLEATNTIVEKVRSEISGPGWINYLFTTVHPHDASIYVQMTKKKLRSISQADAMQWIREKTSHITDAKISVSPVANMSGGGGRFAALQLEVKGKDFTKIEAICHQLIAFLNEKGGYTDLDLSYEKGKPEIDVSIKRDNANVLGVDPANIAQTIHALIAGVDVSKFRSEGDRFNITLRLNNDYRKSIDDLMSLSVRNHSGKLIPLSSLVEAKPYLGPVQIERHNRLRTVNVYVNFEHGKKVLGDAMKEINAYIDTLDLPVGYSIGLGGEAEAMKESFGYLFFALILAVVAVYMVLASQFENFSQPLIIMLSLPFSLIGSLGILILTQQTLSIFTMIGIIMLMGLVTKNAILLLDYTNTLQKRDGLDKKTALLQAGLTRLHPILMTTLAMIFGMLPIALGRGEGAETRAPMALAIIGGLTTSMFLTLIIVPVCYSVSADIRPFFKRSFQSILTWCLKIINKKKPQELA